MRIHHCISILAPALLMLVASCQSSTFGHRSASTDPDERLAALMSSYDGSRGSSAGDDGSKHEIVDPERVRNELERLSLEFPAHVPTLMANGVLAYEHGKPVTASRYLDAIFALEASHPEAAIQRARIAIEEGNLPFARKLLTTQIDYRPDHFGLRESMASVQFLTQDYSASATSLDSAAKLGAPAWRVAFHRGLVAKARGDRLEALRQFEIARAGNPTFRPAIAQLAGLQVELP